MDNFCELVGAMDSQNRPSLGGTLLYAIIHETQDNDSESSRLQHWYTCCGLLLASLLVID